MIRIFRLALVIAAFCFCVPAFGAMNVRVVHEAPIHSKPDSMSEVVRMISTGQILRSSSETKDGWYKVAVPGAEAADDAPGFGWIQRSDVRPASSLRDLRAAGIQAFAPAVRDVSRHYFVLRGAFAMNYAAPKTLQDDLGGAKKALLPTAFGGSLGVRLSTVDTIAATYRYLQFSGAGDSLTYSGVTNLVGLAWEHTTTHELPWKVGFQIGGGAAMSGELSATAGGTTTTFSAGLAPFGELKILGHWYAGESFALVMALGGRYLSLNFTRESVSSKAGLHSAFAEAAIQIEF